MGSSPNSKIRKLEFSGDMIADTWKIANIKSSSDLCLKDPTGNNFIMDLLECVEDMARWICGNITGRECLRRIGRKSTRVCTLSGMGIGSIIGTLIFPGIGTVVGAAVGGCAGYAAGRYIQSKSTELSIREEDTQEYKYGAYIDALKVFELKEKSNNAEVEAQRKRLLFKYHPDKNHGREEDAHQKFTNVGVSYIVIVSYRKAHGMWN